MKPEELIKKAEDKLVSLICGVKEMPEEWLPITVFVEEDNGCPVYTRYYLEEIREDGSCVLSNPQTGEEFSSRHLYEINVEWLAYVWRQYLELCAEQHLIPVSEDEILEEKKPELLAFVWNCRFFGRDVPDKKVIEMWKKSPARSLEDPEDENFYEVECLTSDKLAERINDEAFAHAEDYVRFIKVDTDLLHTGIK